MGWFYLLIAAVFEIGWPFGLKMASFSTVKIYLIIFAVLTMTLSGLFLYYAQKEIPVGTAYAIWTGIGAVGTFLLGILVFHDSTNLLRFMGVVFIILGVIMLKLCH